MGLQRQDDRASDAPRRTVLLVDDDADVRLVTEVTLVRLGGFAVTGVGTARDAMAVLALRRPDVVLLDLQLPDADGLALAAEIARTPGLEKLPIIFMSGYRMDELEARPDRPSVVGSIQKPFDPLTLAGKVRELAGWT